MRNRAMRKGANIVGAALIAATAIGVGGFERAAWAQDAPPGDAVEGKAWYIRELPGIIFVLAYLLLLPPFLAKTIMRSYFIKMGFIRYITMANLLLFMMSLPIKMVLRWSFNLKYIVAIPEYFFNI